MQVTAIVVAAGKGERMGMGINKVYLEILNKPVLAYSLELLQASKEISQIIVVAAVGEVELAETIVRKYGITKAKNIVEGGRTRFRSVAAALPYISCTSDYVAVHDGARPFLTSNDLKAVIKAAIGCQGAILATPVQNTIKQATHCRKDSDDEVFVASTLKRQTLWQAMTPQVFPVELFLDAYTSLDKNVTDDSSLVEALGAKVKIVEGSVDNIKITTPLDLKLGELLLIERG